MAGLEDLVIARRERDVRQEEDEDEIEEIDRLEIKIEIPVLDLMIEFNPRVAIMRSATDSIDDAMQLGEGGKKRTAKKLPSLFSIRSSLKCSGPFSI